MFGIVHYGDDAPRCGDRGWLAIYSDDPEDVEGCRECMELAGAELVKNQGVIGCMEKRQEIAGPRFIVSPPVVRRVDLSGVNILPQKVRRVSFGNIVKK